VIINEISDSGASGNDSLIRGRAGATAAPPISIIMADKRRKSNVHFVGWKGLEIMPYLIIDAKISKKCSWSE